MFGLGVAQSWVSFALTLAGFGVELFALIHAARTRPDAFIAADKRTKTFWLAILGGAVLLGFLSIGPFGLGLLAILAIVAAGIYLADVKPALDQVLGRNAGRDGRRDGPYGPW